MGEYFRDAFGQDVLIFIDNVFRFLQAGSEVSTLLGRMNRVRSKYVIRSCWLSAKL